MRRQKLFLFAGLVVLATLLALASGTAGPPLKGAPAEAKGGTGDTVVVKFVEGSGVRLRGGELRDAAGQPLADVAVALGGARVFRLFTPSETDLASYKAKGEARSGKKLKDLNLFYQVEVPQGRNPSALAAALNSLDVVENAYVVPQPEPPPVTPDFEPQQGYLDNAASSGIGARIGWLIPGGRGAGVVIADVEYCWNNTHEDLSKASADKILVGSGESPTCPTFSNDPDGRQHGTSVIGELIADNNGFGVTGIASDADIRLSPVIINGTNDRPNAILKAALAVGPGNLVLIEQQTQGAHGGCDASGQTGCVPVEYRDGEFAAIQVATAIGVVVVEAAGNGSENLDDAAYAGSNLDRSQNDSGAIIVGAGWPPGLASGECAEAGNACVARSKIGFSTYGSRVDVQGWGTGIVTTGYGDLQGPANSNTAYAAGFGGTSGASPIVAGAAAIIQGTRLARGAPPLGPGDMRALLSSTGTPQQDSINFPAASSHIGPLPNIAAALTADVQVTKSSVPNPAVAGERIYYTLTVTNNGPNFAPNVVVTDTLPAQVTFELDSEGLCTESAPGTLTCAFGHLAVGASRSTVVWVSVHANAVSAAGGPVNIINTANVSSDLADQTPENNVATELTMIEDLADLRVTKLCKPDDQLLAGETATCTIYVDNLGPSDARNVELTDANLANGIFTFGTITTSQGSCSTSGNVVSCDLGTLPAASTTVSGRATVTIEITATEAMDINDVATVVSDTPDPDTSNNQAQDSISVTAVANLEVCKFDAPGQTGCTGGSSGQAGPDPVIAGDNLRYELLVTNNGPSTAVNVVVEDVLPAEVSIVSVTSSSGECNAGVPGDPFLPTTCTFDTMPYGRTDTMWIVVKVKPDAVTDLVTHQVIIHNDARASSETFDPDNSDNLASADTTVQARADLAIAKTSDKAAYKPSSTVTYTITVVNNGPSDAQNVVVTDNLPTTRQAIYLSDTGGCTKSGLTLTCNMGTIAAGDSRSFNLYVTIRGSRGLVSNTASITPVSGSTPDPNLADNSSERVVQIKGGR